MSLLYFANTSLKSIHVYAKIIERPHGISFFGRLCAMLLIRVGTIRVYLGSILEIDFILHVVYTCISVFYTYALVLDTVYTVN